MDHDHGDHGDNGVGGEGAGMENMGHNMSPFLFTSTTGFFVLFNEAFITSTGGFLGAFFAVLAFSFLNGIVHGWLGAVQLRSKKTQGLDWAIYGGVSRFLTLGLHYMEMLIVMTMQVYLILAVLFGHSFGWLVYRFIDQRYHISQKISSEDGVTDVQEDKLIHGTEVEGFAVTAKKNCNCSTMDCECDPKACNKGPGCSCATHGEAMT